MEDGGLRRRAEQKEEHVGRRKAVTRVLVRQEPRQQGRKQDWFCKREGEREVGAGRGAAREVWGRWMQGKAQFGIRARETYMIHGWMVEVGEAGR